MLVALRALGGTALLLVAYYLLPLDASIDSSTVAILAGGLVLLVLVGAWRIRGIIRSDRPGLRAIETLTAALPLYILLFAAAYYLASRANPATFTEPLNRTGALYLSVTAFTTVGFGDITPKTDAARLVVTGQLFLDLIVLGAGAKIILGAVNLSRKRHSGDTEAEPQPDLATGPEPAESGGP